MNIRLVVTLLAFLIFLTPTIVTCFSSVPTYQWEIVDEITPSLNYVDWVENGISPESPSWISDGRWLSASSYFILVTSPMEQYIFGRFEEAFNWTAVNNGFENDQWQSYEFFEDFRSHVSSDPSWWLTYSWGCMLSADSLEKVNVVASLDEDTNIAQLEMSCHITDIPGYFLTCFSRSKEMGIGGYKLPDPLFAGVDLKYLYNGAIEALQLSEVYHSSYSSYRAHFKIAANVLHQYLSTYTCTLALSSKYGGATQNVLRYVNVTMPADTVVQATSPEAISTYQDNVATFALQYEDLYPTSFVVQSWPPAAPERTLAQIFLDNITYWVTDPSYWVVFGSLIAIIYGTITGNRLWKQRRTYYRLYRSMIRIYDNYSTDSSKFSEEIATISKSITDYFIENKITDDQFDRLLSRRDDLITRVQTAQ